VARGDVMAIILCAQVYEKDLKTIRQKKIKLERNRYFKTNATIENWDKEAEKWDKNLLDPNHYVNWENGYQRFLRFMDKELPLVDKKKAVIALDSGCGTGAISDILNKKGYEAVATDISPKMLVFAQKNEKDRQYVLANSLDIPFADNFFDLVCSRGVLISHVGRKYTDLFLAEHNRVLKPNGLFMFDFITKFKESEIKNKKEKVCMSFKKVSDKLKTHGFEVLKRSGEDLNRVNAILCKKI
jgi:ubiquinone/menaquinone biosynthesis C-methylase UbiE